MRRLLSRGVTPGERSGARFAVPFALFPSLNWSIQVKVVRSVTKDGNLSPPVFNVIHAQTLPDTVVHATTYRLRHPQAIYAVSLDRLLKAYLVALDEYAELSLLDAPLPFFVTLGPRPGKLGLRRARAIEASEVHEPCSQQHLKLAGEGGASQHDKRGT